MKMTMILKISAALLLTLLWVAIPAYATGNQNHECQGGHNCNEGGEVNVEAEAESKATATAESVSGATATSNAAGGAGGEGGTGGSAHATNEGVTVDASDSSSVENNSSNIVLVPNNNTENCLRVIGLAFGRNGESAAFGWPYRSKKCDYEGAADDAFAAGERELGWFWKCENPNLYKSFRDKGESKESAKTGCLGKMLGGVTAVKTISTLTEQLEFSENERRIARQKHLESTERLTQACNESKGRMLEACVTK
jgi:hypothetical protein